MSFKKNTRKILATLFLVFSILAVTPAVTNAQLNVGGRLFYLMSCLNGVNMVFVWAPSATSLGYYTAWWAYYKPAYNSFGHGNLIKGKYFVPGVCVIYCGVTVCTIPTKGMIYDFGTSTF
jgi:hypothetical protein